MQNEIDNDEMTLRDVFEYAGLTTTTYVKGATTSLAIVCKDRSHLEALGDAVNATQGDLELVLELGEAIKTAVFDTTGLGDKYIIFPTIPLEDYEQEDA